MSRPVIHMGASEADVALRDGSTIHIRPVAAEDRPAIGAFLGGLSPEAIGFRLRGVVDLEWAMGWPLDVDRAERCALVAVAGARRAPVACAAYLRTGAATAEVAFVATDAWRGRGLTAAMLARLAAAARERGIELFTAEVLPHNHRAIAALRDGGFPVELRSSGDVLAIELPTSLSAEALERFGRREQTAAVAAVRSFLCPHAVAVIGASPRRRTAGAEVLRNILAGSFAGAVYPVDGATRTLQGQRVHPSMRELPERVDLAVLAVPAARVADVALECGAAGVRALVALGAGFAEEREEGGEAAECWRELLEICRETGMWLAGPNSAGLLNTAPEVRLNATLARGVPPPPGGVGLLARGGSVGLAIFAAAARRGLGLSSFLSLGDGDGDGAVLAGEDVLRYWEEDPRTEVALLYLESLGDPRRFARVARRVSASKPIVAVSPARPVAPAHAGGSRIGALVAAAEIPVDALFAQAGAIRVGTVGEMLDVAALLLSRPRRLPAFDFPEDAARARAHAARYAQWRERPRGAPPELRGLRPEAAAAIVAAGLITGGGWLAPGVGGALLRCYGLPLAAQGAAAQPGVELLMGVLHDESFGPLLACAAGGPDAELRRDVAVRITPLTDVDAAEMLRSLRAFALLEGGGGAPCCDVAAVEALLLRLSALVEGHPEVAEIDASAIAGPAGASIVDARVRLAPAPPPARARQLDGPERDPRLAIDRNNT